MQITIHTLNSTKVLFLSVSESPPETTKLPSAPKVKKLFLERERERERKYDESSPYPDTDTVLYAVRSTAQGAGHKTMCLLWKHYLSPDLGKKYSRSRPWHWTSFGKNQEKSSSSLLALALLFKRERDNFSRFLLFEQNNSTPLGRGNRLLKNVLFFFSLSRSVALFTKLNSGKTSKLNSKLGWGTRHRWLQSWQLTTMSQNGLTMGVVSRHSGVRFSWFWYLNFVWRSIAVKLSQWASNIDRGQSTAVALVCQWHWIFFHVIFVCYYFLFFFFMVCSSVVSAFVEARNMNHSTFQRLSQNADDLLFLFPCFYFSHIVTLRIMAY